VRIGKILFVVLALALVGSTSIIPAVVSAQQITTREGPVNQQINAPQTRGDDQLMLAQPNGCIIRASRSRGCDVILCKAMETIAIRSARGIQIAKTVAESRAIAMQRSFIEQTLSTSLDVSQNTKQLSNEGLNSEGQAQVLTDLNETIKRGASGILRGVAVEEDGIEESSVAGQYFAYVISKTSCRLTEAARNSGAAMSGSSSANPTGGAAGHGQGPGAPSVTRNPDTLNPIQRRGGGLD